MRRFLAKKKLLTTGAWIACSWPALARAQTATAPHREHVRFSYRAPEGCPSEPGFLDLVRARDAEIIADDQAARSISITIGFDEKWHAALESEGIANGKSARTIDGNSCEAVAKSIAIFTAIALREGSPDELPPAHPELQTPEHPEKLEDGFPMAAPPPPPKWVLGLHRDRFALTLKTSIAASNGEGTTAGVGLSATQFFTEWFGIELEATWIHALSLGDDNQQIARALGYFEFEAMHAHGSLAKSDRGNVLDLFFNIGAGAIVDRHQAFLADESKYKPDFLYSCGIGLRAFLTRSLALTLDTEVYIYNQNGQGYGSFATGPVAELGFTWFLSPARKWQQ